MTQGTAFTRRGTLIALMGSTAALAGLARPASAASLAEIKARGSMVVATEDDFRPFEFVQDGKPTGFDSELLAILRKQAPFKIQQEIIPWTGLLPGVSTGKYDAAVTAALITKEREQFLDFCSPIAEATDYYVKRKSDQSINAVKDLSGKRCGAQAGSAMLNQLPQLEAMLKASGGTMGEIVQYVSYPEAYQDLAIGRLDYVVNTVINLQSLVSDKPRVFALGQPVSGKIYISWAVKKGNADIRGFLDDFLMAQRGNGTLYALQEKWFGQSFKDMPEHWTAES
jgi:polar amino acid transport system substrate-binding protein